MLIHVDPSSGVPVFRQIMDQIRFQVASGALPPGTELMSTRALSERLGINPMTVGKAYTLLEREGVLVRRAGLAHVVSDSPATSDAAKREHLAAALQPGIVAAMQLGFGPAAAARIYRELLDEARRNAGDDQ
jgi:GntR family transcriptional regulator